MGMNREEVIAWYQWFLARECIEPHDAVLGFGAALVYHGLRETTNDLDISLHPEEYEDTVEYHYLPIRNLTDGISMQLAQYSPNIDIHGDGTAGGVMMPEGFMVDSLEKILEQKLQLNRAKDQADIAAIKAVLGL